MGIEVQPARIERDRCGALIRFQRRDVGERALLDQSEGAQRRQDAVEFAVAHDQPQLLLRALAVDQNQHSACPGREAGQTRAYFFDATSGLGVDERVGHGVVPVCPAALRPSADRSAASPVAR